MGFKRTSEGRVFFSGASGASNDETNFNEMHQKSSVLTEKAQKSKGTGSQLQVLSLLKSLNDKLQLSQIERTSMRQELDSYRKLVESLETKTRAAEEAYQDFKERPLNDSVLQKAETVAAEAMAELAKTRALMMGIESKAETVDRRVNDLVSQSEKHKQVSVALSKKQVQLERKAAEQDERLDFGAKKYRELISRVDNTDAKLGSALEKQERFLARLEQEAQERALFMERIEQKALIAGNASVTVDDERYQKAALLQPHKQDPRLKPDARESMGRKFVMFWQRPFQLSTPVIVIAAIGFALAGWGISQVQQPVLPNLSWQPEGGAASEMSASEVVAGRDGTAAQWQTSDDVSDYVDLSADKGSFGRMGLISNPEASESINVPSITEAEKMDAIMGGQADDIAAALNQIEPGADTGADIVVPEPVAKVKEPVQAAAPKDAPKATNLPAEIREIEAMAREGVAEAQHDLAAIYVTGHAGVEQNYETAAYWFEKSANGGVANASYNLGVLHHQGLGATKDIKEALRWYSQAAEQGHPEAQYNLGIAYIEGIGVEYDPAAASLHFESAAQNGVTEAAYNLGLIYENGLLGSVRPDEALMWYKLAADEGSAEAQSALDQLAQSLNIEMSQIERIVDDVRGDRQIGGAAAVSTSAPAQSSIVRTVTTSTAVSGQNLVRRVQSFLMDAGLYPGPADGRMGPLTRDAIRSYQSIYKLDVDGEATGALLDHMQGGGA